MNKHKFISAVQEFVAIEAAGASALRGQGKSVLGEIRVYLGQLDLRLGNIKPKDHTVLDKPREKSVSMDIFYLLLTLRLYICINLLLFDNLNHFLILLQQPGLVT